MDEVIGACQQFNAKASTAFDQTWKLLKSTKDDVLMEKLKAGDALNVLQPSDFSLVYVWILTTRLRRYKVVDGMEEARLLMHSAAKWTHSVRVEDVRACGEKVFQLGQGLINLADQTRGHLAILHILFSLVCKMSVGAGHFTSIHTLFAQICLSTKSYSYALRILKHPIQSIEPIFDSNVTDFMLYQYYSGCIFTGLHDWEQALDSFAMAISVPSNVTSAIQIESYKKYILVSLVANGNVKPLPRYLSPMVGKTVKTVAGPYFDFANNFEGGNIGRFRMDYNKFKDVFVADGNDGLAQHALEALLRRNVVKLTATYLTLSFKDLSSFVGQEGDGMEIDGSTEEMERMLVGMVSRGEVACEMDKRADMVAFKDVVHAYDTVETVEKLKNLVSASLNVVSTVQDRDEQILRSRDYAQKSVERKKGLGPYTDLPDESFGK
jgi:COP9 signalosome complex subunit 3